MSDRPASAPTEPDREPGAEWAWVGILGLAALGLALALYLVWEHYVAWTDPNLEVICDISEALSCSAVSRTPYAVFLGMPVATWGVLGYLLIAAVGFWGWFSRSAGPAVAALGILAGVSATVSLVLGIVSKVSIGVLCPFCLGTYGVNGALAVLAVALFVRVGWRGAWRQASLFVRQHLARCTQLAALGALALLLLLWSYPKYWTDTDPLAEQLRAMPAPPPSSSDCEDTEIGSGVTEDGHHWIGARSPEVTITEFSDYQCPFCALAHHKLRALIEAYPTTIRAIHRHFPLDQACNPIIQEPFHPAACYYAGLAACAGEQGKFWAANDHLYLHGREPRPIEVGAFAAELGLDRAALESCLEERAWGLIRPDLEAGIRLELRGTPSFLVDGKLHMGADPAEILAPHLPGGGQLRATPGTAELGPKAAGSSAGEGVPNPPVPAASASAVAAPRAERAGTDGDANP